MSMAQTYLRFTKCQRGSNAVEFALIAPALIMLVVGTMWACLLVFSAASLHYSVEQAARCYSVNSTLCGTPSSAQTYAQSQYRGTNAPTFLASTPACGHQVAATVTVALNSGIKTWNVPLSATSCFP